ncbi:hypothetical protein, partial [Chromobacterium piscinae]|uniref:hypothetical protein n=1 Tax=Chromobacterium piscinae TaxID=686831 RepID=UPI0032616EFD
MTEQQTPPAFRVDVVAYRQTETPFVSASAPLAEAAVELGRRAGAEAGRHAADVRVDDYVVTSTVAAEELAAVSHIVVASASLNQRINESVAGRVQH